MRVQRVVMPDSGLESWTVLGEDGVALEPVERFLAYLGSIERSPNTVKAYAHDLKDWFGFLAVQRLDWQAVTVEDVAGFVGWLRLPPAARDGRVRVLPTVEQHCAGASVNRKLAALTEVPPLRWRLDSLVSYSGTGARVDEVDHAVVRPRSSSVPGSVNMQCPQAPPGPRRRAGRTQSVHHCSAR